MKLIFNCTFILLAINLLFSTASIAKDTSTNINPISIDIEGEDSFNTRYDELLALLNWAAYLTEYKTSGTNPRLEFRPHEFFVKNACLGNEKCKVVGWYNDTGIVYIDEMLGELNTQFARSLVVHEFVHYLQHISGDFETGTCEDFVQREREAYATQREFIMAYGSMPNMSFHQHSCALDTTRETQLVRN